VSGWVFTKRTAEFEEISIPVPPCFILIESGMDGHRYRRVVAYNGSAGLLGWAGAVGGVTNMDRTIAVCPCPPLPDGAMTALPSITSIPLETSP